MQKLKSVRLAVHTNGKLSEMKGNI